MSNKAREFAIAAHGDQKYGSSPYSVHLDAVASIIVPYGEIATTVAYLHDILEDTEITIHEINREFGLFVTTCVEILSDQTGENRKDKKVKTYAKMATVTGSLELALTVKAADRLANVRACVQDVNQRLFKVYKFEHAIFKEAVYRSGQCDKIWAELDNLLQCN